MEFFKYEALGNDYIVIDPSRSGADLQTQTIKYLCDRHFGPGSDGVLYGPLFEGGEIRMRIFNPDGSEAEKSGNGIRIFARYLRDSGYVTEDSVELLTAGGRVAVRFEQGNLIRVSMGKVSFVSRTIPAEFEQEKAVDVPLEIGTNRFLITACTIGNPHCVIKVPKVEKRLAVEFGELIERDLHFPNRVNVQFMQVIDRGRIRIEIWERGAGYTLASGSSSCAAASVARLHDDVDRHVIVEMAGGCVSVDIDDEWAVTLTGKVEPVYRGTLLK